MFHCHLPYKVNVHVPTDAGNMRENGVEVPMGTITTIRVNSLELISHHSLRDLTIERRDCRFSVESEDLSNFKYYSKENCIFDCRMRVAESICGCRPWDYPTPDGTTRICDFYGSSCFNSVLQGEVSEDCNGECDFDCNEVKHSVQIETKPLEDEVICSYETEHDQTFEFRIQHYINTLFSDSKWFDHIANAVTNKGGPPERLTLKRVDDIINQTRVPYYNGTLGGDLDPERLAFIRDCKAKVKFDIAVVEVIINAPSIVRMIKTLKVTVMDKLANFGRFSYLNKTAIP